jgi:hypothetical protein
MRGLVEVLIQGRVVRMGEGCKERCCAAQSQLSGVGAVLGVRKF